MKLFELRRSEDESGVSGAGVVAQGVIFDNGWCSLTWLTEHTSVAFYTSVDAVVAIHGHNGKTRVVQVANVELGRVRGLVTNAAQDDMENTNFAQGHGTRDEMYLFEQRNAFADVFREIIFADPAAADGG